MSQGNRRFTSNPWVPYIGDCKAAETYLQSRTGVVWTIPKYLNALLRGIAQVILANNPLAGFIILIALFWADVSVGLAAVVAATTAIITAVTMRQDPAAISAGLTTYNAVLVGTVTSSVWAHLYGEELSAKLWVFIVVGAALSVYVSCALENILSSMRVSLPALALPFNVVIVPLFISLMPLKSTPEIIQEQPVVILEEDLDWGRVFTGIVLASGHVYGVKNVISSILIYIGVFVYSPILCVMGIVGATIGTIFATFLEDAPYDSIYAGLWGYNALMSFACASGFFIVLTCHSFGNAVANVLFTGILQKMLIILLKPLRLPVFTLPFVLSSLLFLSVTSSGNQLPRAANITFPEMHCYIYRETKRQNEEDKCGCDGELGDARQMALMEVSVAKNGKNEVSAGSKAGEVFD